MNIAIQAADLDAERIDGTRVYIYNLLKHFGQLDARSRFLIFHRKSFNPELIPPVNPNYRIIQKDCPFLWTQTRFAYELWRSKADVLWMPMHNIPYIRRKNLRTVVTIHDLAFKYFPDHFPKSDLRKITLLTDRAITQADKIIAISHSTKRDIIKFYPTIATSRISVVHHGFDGELFSRAKDEERERAVKRKFNIQKNYIVYPGALQPRKNLELLIDAFDLVRARGVDLQLVLAGEKAWKWEGILEKARVSRWSKDIILTGKTSFTDMGELMRGASLLVYPSLYEGFGIPILEGFSARTPVICANNSALPEVAGQAAIYFDDHSSLDLAEKIADLYLDNQLRVEMIDRGLDQIKNFSWQHCAQKTLDLLTKW